MVPSEPFPVSRGERTSAFQRLYLFCVPLGLEKTLMVLFLILKNDLRITCRMKKQKKECVIQKESRQKPNGSGVTNDDQYRGSVFVGHKNSE